MPEEANSQFHKSVTELTRLAAAQIRVTVNEADESVEDLTLSFTKIVEQDKAIKASIAQLPDIAAIKEIKEQISHLSTQIGKNVINAAIAFQFYDRLCQKLDHTSNYLKDLSEIESDGQTSCTQEILHLRDKVYNHFTMEEERLLFDAVLTSKDFEQAITDYTNARARLLLDNDDDNAVELF